MMKQTPRWMNTIGRVAFMNCDPLFVGLDESFHVLPAPPSWLTGHLLRRDCVLAPIPAADFAKHHDELALVPEIGICSKGEVGSVLVFGNRPLEEMRDIALPTDSSSSVALLKFLLNERKLDPRPVEMGPDLDTMLERCDGASHWRSCARSCQIQSRTRTTRFRTSLAGIDRSTDGVWRICSTKRHAN